MNFEKPDQPKLAKHDASVLDLAFLMDCTGSMGCYIANAQNSIRDIVEAIVSSEKSDVRLALVEYRDHPPQDTTFITRKHDFTSSVKTMKEWLDACSAQGGGDAPEAVADALNDANNLSWREESTKICILISDAPPHGLDQNCDSFPNGCPSGYDPLKLTRDIAQKGITLYCVGCEPAIVPYRDFFMALAYMTGGQYVPLSNASLLAKVIIGSAQEEISLEKLMSNIQHEVDNLVETSGGAMSTEAMSKFVQTKLQSDGVKVKKMQMFNSDYAKPSSTSKMYSGMKDMSELRNAFKTTEPQVTLYGSPFMSAVTKSSSDSFSFSGFGAPSKICLSSGAPESLTTNLFISAPPPPSTSASIGPLEEDFKVENEYDIDNEQAERLVQKALIRSKK
jgi:Mg-chelatase subunit ChlD